MEINGIAHVILTVSDWDTSRAFYSRLLEYLGLTKFIDVDGFLYFVGGKTAIGISKCDEEYRRERFVQRRVGLHHLCLRARSREDVDSLHRMLIEMRATIVHPPEEGPWLPGYYSLLFEDPDGIRIEVNHLPGRGFFELAQPQSSEQPQ